MRIRAAHLYLPQGPFTDCAVSGLTEPLELLPYECRMLCSRCGEGWEPFSLMERWELCLERCCRISLPQSPAHKHQAATRAQHLAQGQSTLGGRAVQGSFFCVVLLGCSVTGSLWNRGLWKGHSSHCNCWLEVFVSWIFGLLASPETANKGHFCCCIGSGKKERRKKINEGL